MQMIGMYSLIAALLVGAAAPQQEGSLAEEELAKLQGTWRQVSAKANGADLPPFVVQAISITIDGNTKSVVSGGETIGRDVTIELDPEATPKVWDERPGDDRTGRSVVRGIYKVEGDTLTRCIALEGDPRPEAFESRRGTGHTLQVFRRVERDDAGPRIGDEYVRVAEAIISGDVSLPRISDEQGAEKLGWLTSMENLSPYRDDSLPLTARLEDFFELQGAVNAILKQYVVAANEGEEVHEETACVLAFSLRIAAVGFELIEAFLPTIPRDETYPARMEGLRQVRSGLTTLFVGTERSLSEREFYSAEDLSLMLDAMATTLPVLRSAFPPEYPAQLREQLETHRASFTDEKDRQNIDRMLDELGPDAS